MKKRLLLVTLLWTMVSLRVQAQGVCGSASNVYAFTDAANDNLDWKANSATVGLTTFSTSAFSSTANVATFRTEDWAANDQRLVWEANYSSKGGTSTVTFTFSRPVSNLKLAVGDIDRNTATGVGNDFQDAVTFNGYTTDDIRAANLISLADGNVVNSRTGLTRSGNTITDNTNTDNGDGTTTVTFPQAVKKLVLVYSNTETADSDPGNQAISINSLTWCKLTPALANDALTMSYRTSPTINLLANDVADGSFNLASLDLDPTTAKLDAVYTDANGVTYTANPTTGIVTVTNTTKYVGTSLLTYTIKDNAGQAATASLTTTLTNTAPTGKDYQVTRSFQNTEPINLLAGATDADGVITIAAASLDLNPSAARRQATYTIANQGTFTVDDSGLVTFTAVNGFVGTSTLSYTLTDEKGAVSAVQQLVLTTTTSAPVAVSDVATRSNTTKAPIYILTNDSDVDGDIHPGTVDLNPATPAREVSYTDGTKGTYTVDDNGLVSFTALNGFTGTSTLSYLVRDSKGLASNTATITLMVTQTLANDDSNLTPKSTPVSGNVLINDNNKAGTSLSVNTTAVTRPAHGTVTIQTNGTYTYTPTAGYVGNDSFVYRASDGTTTSNATVNIIIYEPTSACTEATGPNLLKNPDFTLGNTGFQTDYTYVVDNDQVTNELNPEGLYAVGTNAANYHNSFAQTGYLGSGNFLMINGSNTIKKLYSQTITVEPNKYYSFSAYVNNILKGVTQTTDDDPVFGFVINGASTSGITSVPENPDTWVRLDDVWFSGNNTTATFEIVNVSTVEGGNDMGIDHVYFGTCNEAPVAVNDLVFVPSKGTTAFPVVLNDVDDGGIEGSSLLLYTADGSGAGVKSLTTAEGTYAVNATTGMLTFTPASGFTGTSQITYKGTDAASATSNAALVTVRVGPITAADVQNMSGKRVATLDVSSNDQDVDGVDMASIDLDPSTPEQDFSRLVNNVGIYQVTPAGIVTFTPVSTFSGTTSIQYTVKDNVGATSNPGTITITLTTPLPVELTQFTATVKGPDVLLSWATAMELQNDHFVVERSQDGRSFTPLATVRGQGTTAQQSYYTYRDAQAQQAASLLYYRLRQVDTNQSFHYSSVQVIGFSPSAAALTFTLYPNPTTEVVTVDLTGLPKEKYSVRVVDVTGRALYTTSVDGGTTSALPVHQLQAGVYRVIVQGTATYLTHQLVKQ